MGFLANLGMGISHIMFGEYGCLFMCFSDFTSCLMDMLPISIKHVWISINKKWEIKYQPTIAGNHVNIGVYRRLHYSFLICCDKFYELDDLKNCCAWDSCSQMDLISCGLSVWALGMIHLAESGLFGAGYPTLAPVGRMGLVCWVQLIALLLHRGMDIHWFFLGKANVGIRIHHEPLFDGQTGYPLVMTGSLLLKMAIDLPIEIGDFAWLC